MSSDIGLEAGFEWIGKDDDGLTYFKKRKKPKKSMHISSKITTLRGFRS